VPRALFSALIAYLAPNIYVMQLSTIGLALLFAPLWSRLSPYVNSIVSKEMRATDRPHVYHGIWPRPRARFGFGRLVADLCGIRNLFAVSAGISLPSRWSSIFCSDTSVFLDEARNIVTASFSSEAKQFLPLPRPVRVKKEPPASVTAEYL
jgi:hypothetical protein